MHSLLRLLYELPGQVDRLVESPDTRQLRLCERLLLLRLGHARKAFGQDLDLASRLAGTAGDAVGVVTETAQLGIVLLRMAMVEHLTKQGEVCPMILDDVTVQCDRPRTIAILELLHELSRERQVIVFTQEDDMRAWADSNLQEPQDRLEILDAAEVPA